MRALTYLRTTAYTILSWSVKTNRPGRFGRGRSSPIVGVHAVETARFCLSAVGRSMQRPEKDRQTSQMDVQYRPMRMLANPRN